MRILKPSSFRFFFTVQEIRIHPEVPPRSTRFGMFKPPKPLGSHVPLQNTPLRFDNLHAQSAYYFDGAQVVPGPNDELSRRLAIREIELYREVSMYFDHTVSQFWCVDFDATANPVGDGLPYDTNEASGDWEEDDDDYDDYDDNPNQSARMDWTPLGFKWPLSPDGMPNAISTIAVKDPHLYNTLYMTRQDQTWPARLLPSNYLPADLSYRNMMGYYSPHGALNGNLAALIALIAFSASPRDDHVDRALTRCIRNEQWQAPEPMLGSNSCK
jgi:hypothetical protein